VYVPQVQVREGFPHFLVIGLGSNGLGGRQSHGVGWLTSSISASLVLSAGSYVGSSVLLSSS
jgi:hypothetical protein